MKKAFSWLGAVCCLLLICFAFSLPVRAEENAAGGQPSRSIIIGTAQVPEETGKAFTPEVMALLNELKSGTMPYGTNLQKLGGYPSTPETEALVLEEAKKITADCTTDRERIYAVYRHVANWYYYDYDYFYNDAFSTGGYESAGGMLDAYYRLGLEEARVGVCADYANYSCALLRSLNIPCLIISGITDGEGHEWNTAYDGTEWIFFDATWGSRNYYYSSTQQYVALSASNTYWDISADYALWGNGQYRTASMLVGVESDGIWGALSLHWSSKEMYFLVYDAVDLTATSLEIPAEIGGPVRIDTSAFLNNPTLEHVSFEGTHIGVQAFQACTALKTVTLTDRILSIGDHAFYGCTALESVTVEDRGTPLQSGNKLGTYAFHGCTSLRRVELPQNLTGMGSLPFFECPNLEEVVFSDQISTLPDNLFFQCTQLKHVDLPDALTTVSHCMFQECTALEVVVLHDGLTTIADGAFWGCESLKEMVIPESVTSIGQLAFYKCRSMERVVLPPGLTTIPQQCFRGCSALTKIELPDTVTSLGDYAIAYCSALETIVLPTGLQSIGEYAFRSNTAMRYLFIPDTVTSLSSNYYTGCSNLEGLYIGGGLTSISQNQFWGLDQLKWIRLPASLQEAVGVSSWGRKAPETVIFAGSNPFGEIAIRTSGITVYYPENDPSWSAVTVPYGTVKTYRPGSAVLDASIWFAPTLTCAPVPVVGKPAILLAATYDEDGKMTSCGMYQWDAQSIPIFDLYLNIFSADAVLENVTLFWLDAETWAPLAPQITAPQ